MADLTNPESIKSILNEIIGITNDFIKIKDPSADESTNKGNSTKRIDQLNDLLNPLKKTINLIKLIVQNNEKGSKEKKYIMNFCNTASIILNNFSDSISKNNTKLFAASIKDAINAIKILFNKEEYTGIFKDLDTLLFNDLFITLKTFVNNIEQTYNKMSSNEKVCICLGIISTFTGISLGIIKNIGKTSLSSLVKISEKSPIYSIVSIISSLYQQTLSPLLEGLSQLCITVGTQLNIKSIKDHHDAENFQIVFDGLKTIFEKTKIMKEKDNTLELITDGTSSIVALLKELFKKEENISIKIEKNIRNIGIQRSAKNITDIIKEFDTILNDKSAKNGSKLNDFVGLLIKSINVTTTVIKDFKNNNNGSKNTINFFDHMIKILKGIPIQKNGTLQTLPDLNSKETELLLNAINKIIEDARLIFNNPLDIAGNTRQILENSVETLAEYVLYSIKILKNIKSEDTKNLLSGILSILSGIGVGITAKVGEIGLSNSLIYTEIINPLLTKLSKHCISKGMQLNIQCLENTKETKIPKLILNNLNNILAKVGISKKIKKKDHKKDDKSSNKLNKKISEQIIEAEIKEITNQFQKIIDAASKNNISTNETNTQNDLLTLLKRIGNLPNKIWDSAKDNAIKSAENDAAEVSKDRAKINKIKKIDIIIEFCTQISNILNKLPAVDETRLFIKIATQILDDVKSIFNDKSMNIFKIFKNPALKIAITHIAKNLLDLIKESDNLLKDMSSKSQINLCLGIYSMLNGLCLYSITSQKKEDLSISSIAISLLRELSQLCINMGVNLSLKSLASDELKNNKNAEFSHSIINQLKLILEGSKIIEKDNNNLELLKKTPQFMVNSFKDLLKKSKDKNENELNEIQQKPSFPNNNSKR